MTMLLYCASLRMLLGIFGSETWEDHPKLNYHFNVQFGGRVAHMALLLIDSRGT